MPPATINVLGVYFLVVAAWSGLLGMRGVEMVGEGLGGEVFEVGCVLGILSHFKFYWKNNFFTISGKEFERNKTKFIFILDHRNF